MGISPQFAPFVTVWETTASDNNITIPTNSNYTYNYTVDWGDGTIENNVTGDITHIYSVDGNHTVKISGEFPTIKFYIGVDEDGDALINNDAVQILSIIAWGDIIWKDMNSSLYKCINLNLNTLDIPELSFVKNMSNMFYQNNLFHQDIGNWDVSNVTNIHGMFYGTSSFNQDIGNWNVSNVTDMGCMFMYSSFNQDIGEWNTSNVTSMASMFGQASSFNQDIGNWDTSNVISMASMFQSATDFNQNLSKWDTSSVETMFRMFKETSSLSDQNLSSWDVGNVIEHTDFMTDTGSGNTEPIC